MARLEPFRSGYGAQAKGGDMDMGDVIDARRLFNRETQIPPMASLSHFWVCEVSDCAVVIFDVRLNPACERNCPQCGTMSFFPWDVPPDPAPLGAF